MKTLVGKVAAGATAVLSSGVFAAAMAQAAPTVRLESQRDLVDLITRISNAATIILLAITVLFVVYAGYLYLSGEEANIQKAKNQLIYVAVAILLLLVAQSIPVLIKTIFTQGI